MFVQTSPSIINMDATLLTLESSFIEQTQEAVRYEAWQTAVLFSLGLIMNLREQGLGG